MRYTLIILLAVILCVSPVFSASPSVIVSDTSVIPSILMPEDLGMITVTLKNTAKTATVTEEDVHEPIQNVKSTTETKSTEYNPVIKSVYLDGKGDIQVMEGNSAFEGELGPEQTVSLSFLIKAPAVKGVYFPVLIVRMNSGNSMNYPIPVNVNLPISTENKPVIVIENGYSGYVAPGDRAMLNLNISNIGGSVAEGITIRIVDSDPEIAPVNTAGFHIDSLDSGESVSYKLEIITSKDAEVVLHELPVSIEYTEVDGTVCTLDESIPVDVRGVSRLDISSIKTEPVRVMGSEPFDLIIRLENTGTGDAKSTTAINDLPFMGDSESFVGKIKQGNDAPAYFSLMAKGAGEYYYNLTVQWEDDWGVHEEEYRLKLAVYGSDMLPAIIVIVLVLIIGGYFGYRYYIEGKKEMPWRKLRQ